MKTVDRENIFLIRMTVPNIKSELFECDWNIEAVKTMSELKIQTKHAAEHLSAAHNMDCLYIISFGGTWKGGGQFDFFTWV